MRYWLLLNDEPAGPYTVEDLDQTPGFSRATLVYPEKRLDPRDERWLRAGDVPQLAVALAGVERRAFAGRYIVPEPTVRDLPVLGAILKQLERFEEELVALQGNLIARHQELVELREDADTDVGRLEIARSEIAKLEERLGKLEPLESDILHLREASLETAQSARQVEEQVTRAVEDVRKRLESLEGNIDTEAQQDMMRIYTASLQERIEALGKELKREREDAAALRGELGRFQSTHSRERAERGFLAGGTLFLAPEAVVSLFIAALLGAVGYLFYAGRVPLAPPAPVVEKTLEPAPAPAPPEPVVLKPEPAKKKPQVKRQRKSSKKRAEQAAREKKVRDTILFRVTGGVPSSRKPVIAERKTKPLPAPESPKN